MNFRRRRRLPSIEVLRLEPGDIVLAHIDRELGRVEADTIQAAISRHVPGHDVLVLAKPVTLGVLRNVGGPFGGSCSPRPSETSG